MSEQGEPITVGVTGPNGFIAGHLMHRLRTGCLQLGSARNQSPSDVRVLPCSRETFESPSDLQAFVDQCDTIVHLAGANRGDEQQIYETNVGLAERLVAALGASSNPPSVVFASSTQRDLPNSYGRSKRDAEERLRAWAEQRGGRLTVLVIPNVFGTGCRPFYNSVVATFCHKLARGETPKVVEDREIELIWIGNLVKAICDVISDVAVGGAADTVTATNVIERRIVGRARLRVSELLARLESLRASYFDKDVVPDLADSLTAHLYTTFLSHIDLEDHRHRPQVRQDERGQLFEILRMTGGGQVFFSTTRPGVVRGNHFHTRKVEWFCVLRGKAAIRLRRVGDNQVREFQVSGDEPEFISIPAMHTHQIENIGGEDLLTMFWCNEIFEPADPDTYYEKVA